ncbi:hypothetical protein [Streptomyces hesseae]|uniref:Transposase n=1 Tax=Streptomyces hesseae TaxID=3075519 RepID=A0ABU2SJS2_9ACTN|nr:hypothetical protein [Streptomyces sp. DSM 40473]MDT0449228.1 hypothetical protein [Streptomyces sp. DSM 40473]
MLAAVRRLNRAELVGETLRAALEELAVADDEWLAAATTPDWGNRYGRPVRYERLPRTKEALSAYVVQVGEDGMHLMRELFRDGAPRRLWLLPQVQVLRQVWVQQYWYDEDDELQWRGPKDTGDRQSRRATERRNTGTAAAAGRPDPATARVPWSGMEIVTPHDPEARFCRKAGKEDWIGYRDHQTETCGDSGANIIVHVATRPAPEQDIDALDQIHEGIVGQGFHPSERLVDSGYVSPDVIHYAQQRW